MAGLLDAVRPFPYGAAPNFGSRSRVWRMVKEKTMDRAKLLDMFRNMATEIAEKDFSNVTEEQVIAELGIDSLGMLELVGAMERDLNVQVPDDELVGIQTVKQLLDLVEKRV